MPVSMTPDVAPNLLSFIEENWPLSLCILCWMHKMNNILGKVPVAHKTEVRAFLTAVRDVPHYASGYQRAEALIKRFEKDFPGFE